MVATDLGIDTTLTGELVANIMAAVSRWERQMIGVRTKEGLAVEKPKGTRLGSTVLTNPGTSARIIEERLRGATLASIADGLNRDLVPCAGEGVKWYPSSTSKAARRSGI